MTSVDISCAAINLPNAFISVGDDIQARPHILSYAEDCIDRLMLVYTACAMSFA